MTLVSARHRIRTKTHKKKKQRSLNAREMRASGACVLLVSYGDTHIELSIDGYLTPHEPTRRGALLQVPI